MTESDSEKQKLQGHVSQLWPLVQPEKYENELELYREVRKTVWEKHIDPVDPRYLDVVSSTTLVSHRTRDFDTLPHLWAFGPKDSGKTTILRLFARLTNRPLLVSSVSPASIFQVVSKFKPTLLFDEADRLGFEKSEYAGTMLQLLNVYNRETRVIRGSKEGSDPLIYDVFGLKIIVSTQPLSGTLPDRCVRLDCEHNVRRIPVMFDEQAIGQVRRKLEYYNSIHESKTFTPQISVEELNEKLGDNRTTQLFYPLIEACPDPEGRDNLLSLARDLLVEKRGDEENSDLARVLEATIKAWTLAGKPDTVPVKAILGEYNTDLDGPEQLKSTQIGWRLKKLQIRRTHTDKGSVAHTDERKLYRQARRYTPLLAIELSEPSEPSVPSQKADNSPILKIPEPSAFPSQSDNSDNSDGFPRLTRPGVDLTLLKDYIVRTAIPSEMAVQTYADTSKITYACSMRFGDSVKRIIASTLKEIADEGRIKPGPFHDTWLSKP